MLENPSTGQLNSRTLLRIVRSALKAVLGAGGINLFQRGVAGVRRIWLRLAMRSVFFARLYYLLVSSAFDREIRAVICGHLAFEQNREGAEPVNYFLRRCIHRIEKGLIMRPRREIFALDYIDEAVIAYRKGLNVLSDDEMRWAHDVLEEYFQAVSSHPVVDRARAAFASSLSGQTRSLAGETRYVPYSRRLGQRETVAFEDLKALSIQRRSVRWYRPEPVPRCVIDQALHIAGSAPSACNRQPLEYRIIDDPAVLPSIVSLPPGMVGYAENIPAIAVVIGRLRAYPNPRDRHVVYIDGGLSAMSFMYALETLGLSSCAINWPDIAELEAAMSHALGLTGDERVVMLIAFGYPDPAGLVPHSKKVPLDAMRSYNKIGGIVKCHASAMEG